MYPLSQTDDAMLLRPPHLLILGLTPPPQGPLFPIPMGHVRHVQIFVQVLEILLSAENSAYSSVSRWSFRIG